MHKRCLHDGKDFFEHFYRFDVCLSDESLQSTFSCIALRSSIWEAAAELLNMSATAFAKLNPNAQMCIVHEATTNLPICFVMLRVQCGQVHVQTIEVIQTTSVLQLKAVWSPRTPKRGLSRVKDTQANSHKLLNSSGAKVLNEVKVPCVTSAQWAL